MKTNEQIIEEFDERYEQAWKTEKGRHNRIRWLLKSWLRTVLEEKDNQIAEARREERERLFNADTLKLGDHYLSEEGIRELMDYKLKKQQ